MARNEGLAQYPEAVLSIDSPSWEQVLLTGSDQTFSPPLRGVLCNTESTISYRSHDGTVITFMFPPGLHTVMMRQVFASGSTFSQGDVLGLF